MRRGWRHDGAAEKLRDLPITQFIGAAFAHRPWRTMKAGFPELDPGVSPFAILAETLVGLLKFVVRLRLPTGPFPKQHYISESPARVLLGGVQRGLELKGGRLPGIRHHSNLETRIRGLR